MNLVAERVNRGLSVRQLAEHLELNPAVIARAEKGEAVHPANAKKIADFYGFKVTDIWPVDAKTEAAA